MGVALNQWISGFIGLGVFLLGGFFSFAPMAQGKPASETDTIFHNGVNAAGFGELHLNDYKVIKGSLIGMGVRVGWQLARFDDHSLAIGFAGSGVGSNDFNYSGGSANLNLFSSHYIHGGLSYVDGSGRWNLEDSVEGYDHVSFDVQEVLAMAILRLTNKLRMIGAVGTRQFQLTKVPGLEVEDPSGMVFGIGVRSTAF